MCIRDSWAVAAADTDRYALDSTRAQHRIWLTEDEKSPETSPKLTPQQVYTATTESLDRLAATLRGCRWVVVLVCLGGATGQVATPIVCLLARQMGLATALVAALPFPFEGPLRRAIAESSLAELPQAVDAALLLDNRTLAQRLSPRYSLRESFAASDAILVQTIGQLVATEGRFDRLYRLASQSAWSWRNVL
jgi:cell division GTPase FtsZ